MCMLLIFFSFCYFFFSLFTVVNLLIAENKEWGELFYALGPDLSTLIVPIPFHVAKNHLEYQAQGLLKLIVTATFVKH